MSADITADYIRSALIYDADTGILVWRQRADARPQWNATYVGKEAGTIKENGYRYVTVNNRRYRAHRLIWFYIHGEWPTRQIDHINGNRSDNRLANLREATNEENAQNRRVTANSASGLVGVAPAVSGRWHAHITKRGRIHHLGTFDTKQDALAAYFAAKARLHTFHPTARPA